MSRYKGLFETNATSKTRGLPDEYIIVKRNGVRVARLNKAHLHAFDKESIPYHILTTFSGRRHDSLGSTAAQRFHVAVPSSKLAMALIAMRDIDEKAKSHALR